MMKKIFLFTILSILFSQNLKSQIINAPDPYTEYDLALGIDYQAEDLRYYKDINGSLNPFIGVWKNTTGSKTFKITLWKKEMEYRNGYYLDVICGDYIMVENEGQPNENVLFTSRIMVGSTNPWSPALRLKGNYPALTGTLWDNTAFTASFNYVNQMPLYFKIEPGNTTAHWRLNDKKELGKVVGSYTGTPLPLNIIMTKQ